MRSHYNRRAWEQEKRNLDAEWQQDGQRGAGRRQANIFVSLVFVLLALAGAVYRLGEHAVRLLVPLGAIGILALIVFLVILANSTQAGKNKPDPPPQPFQPDLRQSGTFEGRWDWV